MAFLIVAIDIVDPRCFSGTVAELSEFRHVFSVLSSVNQSPLLSDSWNAWLISSTFDELVA